MNSINDIFVEIQIENVVNLEENVKSMNDVVARWNLKIVGRKKKSLVELFETVI